MIDGDDNEWDIDIMDCDVNGVYDEDTAKSFFNHAFATFSPSPEALASTPASTPAGSAAGSAASSTTSSPAKSSPAKSSTTTATKTIPPPPPVYNQANLFRFGVTDLQINEEQDEEEGVDIVCNKSDEDNTDDEQLQPGPKRGSDGKKDFKKK